MILLWVLAIFGLLVLFGCAFIVFNFFWGMMQTYNDYGTSRGHNIDYSGRRKATSSQENK